jgi:hypothetical protein
MAPRGKTQKRKTRRCPSVATIPELRKSLEHISSYGERLIKGGSKSVKQMASQFASEWKKTFGKTLPFSTAEQYIRSLISMKKGKKTRKMRGGAQNTELMGAPMAHLTRPGVDIPYGNFLKYVDSGFWNPEPAINWDCGKQTSVLPYPETGSNRMNGGGVLSAASFRPFVAVNPPSFQQDMMTSWKGQPLGPGPESWQRGYQYQLPPGTTTANTLPAAAIYTRDLTKDVTLV